MFIGETLANLLAQTLPPHEIIVVDDGSTNKSVEVIHSFGDKIRLIQQAHQGCMMVRCVPCLMKTRAPISRSGWSAGASPRLIRPSRWILMPLPNRIQSKAAFTSRRQFSTRRRFRRIASA